ncbi:MAG TPA: hypothetical protein VG389_03945 [Myxococcota bacterium]|jgi:hypothetical protein|nr:hypothetical protein [Myxococcota bacterium]
MGSPPVAARPSPPTRSVAFLIGTAGFPDGFLVQGRKWVNKIAKAAGGAPGVVVGDLSNDPLAVAAAIQRFSRDTKAATIPTSTMDANLGGLRGHTLVLLTHGLEPHDSGLTLEERRETEGLMFFNKVRGDSPKDLVMFNKHLDFMTTQLVANPVNGEDKEVVTKPKLDGLVDADGGAKFKKDAHGFAQVLNAMRRSIFVRVYLAACGGGRRLATFAEKLKGLTNLSVYWNDDTISFPDLKHPRDPLIAEVGPIVNGVTNPVREGVRFFKADTPANHVLLRSTTDGFLEGSMSRLP